MIDFPASPTVGQSFTAAGVTWIWDGAKWLPSGLSPTVVPGINDNRLINGDMRIDQRNGGASGTAASYTVDRWSAGLTQAGRLTWGQNMAGLTGPSLFPYCLGSTSSGAYTLVAGDTFYVCQIIEADMVSDFAWGTANAQPVMLSFWVYANTNTGLYGGSVKNGASTRSYPFTYSIPTIGVWTKIIVPIPSDTTGTWTMKGNGGALQLTFSYGTGATYSGPANAWASGNYNSASGVLNIFTGVNNGLWITGVKLEIGSVATSYNRQSLAKSMADCQRYFQFATFGLGGNATATATTVTYVQSLPVSMRATPTITPTESNAVNMATRVITPETPSTIRPNGTAANAFLWTGSFTASAEL